MVRIIDLSIPIEDSPSEPLPVMVSHEGHRQAVELMKNFFGCTKQDLPQGLMWANDTVVMGAHAGTHVDSSWHYSPTSEGKRARTIDELPLECVCLLQKRDGLALEIMDASGPKALPPDGAIVALSCLYCPALGRPSQTNSCVRDRIGLVPYKLD
jgi:kynurenine formamidase